MKLFKTVPAVVVLAGGLFASLHAMADNTVLRNRLKVKLTGVIWRSLAIQKVLP